MSEPIFLSVERALLLHEKSILRFGGLSGIRDHGLFEAAVTQPQQTYYYGKGDLYEIAAAYAFHIAQAQACFDGNKRTAIAAALVFLEMNGVSTDFDSLPLYQAMIDIAERRMDKPHLAELLRALCQPQ